MEKQPVTRREFLQTASIAGVAALSVGTIFKGVAGENAPAAAPAPAKTASAPAKKGVFVCSVCGHVEFGVAPENCPVCHTAKINFQQNDNVFTDAETKFKDKIATHAPVVTAKKNSTLITEVAAIAAETRVGSTLHPMDAAHFIRFIDCYIDDVFACRMSLTLHSHPTAAITFKTPGSKVRIVAMCNLHGHWQAEATPV